MKTIEVPELGIEVEIKVHDKGKSFNRVKKLIPKRWRLPTAQECIFLANNKKYARVLKMDGSSSEDDFFIQQPFKLNQKNGYAAWFDAASDRAYLDCNRNPVYSDSSLGVRLVRRISARRVGEDIDNRKK